MGNGIRGAQSKNKQNNNNNTINLIHILQEVFVYSVCALVNGPAYRSKFLARHPSPVIIFTLHMRVKFSIGIINPKQANEH